MRVAIVHYHFRKGGVTRVVTSALRSLEALGIRVAVLAGEGASDPDLEGRVTVVPGLGYRDDFALNAVSELEQDLRRAAREALGGDPDCWHLHNTSLGKNRVWTACVAAMARSGEPMVLQLHDFAEDGRSKNYKVLASDLAAAEGGLASSLYPVGPNVLYATLNSRDRSRLVASGLPEDRSRVLPNPASKWTGGAAPWDTGLVGLDRLILYPSRSIRRKNLGEALFWSATLESGAGIGLTLDPENPTARPVYDRWKALAERWKAPVRFELGRRADLSFDGLIASADAILTTSVAEGFGLAFLEPWTAGKGLLGRDLPGITQDFQEKGLDLNGLYTALQIPVSWIGLDRLRDRAREKLVEALAAFGVDWEEAVFEAGFEAWVRDGLVDFGRLDESLQELVLERLFTNAGARGECLPKSLIQDVPGDRIETNRQLVEAEFGLESYGSQLFSVYQSVGEGTATDSLSPERVLKRFLRLEDMSLLCV